ncbi:MAG: hypothetical protein WHV67_01355 [Thermoanaerobaculia bacterium]
MRKFSFLFFLFFSSFALSQNLQIGGALGIGNSVLRPHDEEKRDLRSLGFYLFTNLEEDTLLQLRGGKIETRKEEEGYKFDLKYYGLTVSYLFDTQIGEAGFFGGISYYNGTNQKIITQGENQFIQEIDVDKIGAMAGLETYIPMTKRISLYLDVELHYIPIKDAVFALNLQGGITIKF